MGLLDNLTNMAAGALAKDGGGGLLPIVLKQLANYPGGIQGLIANFQQGGLGEIVQSWIGSGANLPVTADQLGSVLAPSTVDNIAAESGQSKPAVLEALTGLLPKIVDQATEGGNVPASGSFDASALLGMLSKLG